MTTTPLVQAGTQPISAAPAAGTPSTGASQGAAGLGSLTSQDFLQLLVAQISNQDPLNPVSSSQFMSQTAELSTLEQIASLGQETSQVLAAQQLTSAVAMIGHTVTGTSASGGAISGKVTGVVDASTGPLLDIGSSQVPLSDISTIG